MILAFEGLHGTGKGTQISYLKEALKNRVHGDVIVIKGDGIRSADYYSCQYLDLAKEFDDFWRDLEHPKSPEEWEVAALQIVKELSYIFRLYSGGKEGFYHGQNFYFKTDG